MGLLHLKKLLADDGSIWVHLADVENHRMRLLLDEVFGSTNFIAKIYWQNTYSPKNNGSGISTDTDSILVYAMGEKTSFTRLPRTADMDRGYRNPDSDIKGPWTNGDATARHSN